MASTPPSLRAAVVGLLSVAPLSQVTAATQGFFYPDIAANSQQGTSRKVTAQGPRRMILVPLKSTNIAELGSGFNLLTGLPATSNCLTKFSEKNIVLNDIKSSLSQTIDSEATYYKLNQTVSAKGKYGAFGGEGDYSSTTETKTTYNGTTLVVWAGIERKIAKIAIPTDADDVNRILNLTPKYRRLSRSNGGWEFRETCGDGYVDAIVTGTEMYAVANLKDFTYESKKSMERAIEGSYAGDLFSASASSKLQTELKTSKSFLDIVGWTRGSAQQELATNLNELKALYKRLPSLDQAAARPLYASVVVYSALPSTAKSIPTPYIAFEGLNQSLIRLHFLREVLSDAQTDARLEASKSFLFFPGNGPKETWIALNELAASVDLKIKDLTQSVEHCYADARKCEYSDADRLNDLKNEYLIRAQMPLARSGISEKEAAIIARQMRSGSGTQMKYARSSYADHLFADNILRPGNLRCKDRAECIPPSLLNEVASKICERLGSRLVPTSTGTTASIVCDVGGGAQSSSALSPMVRPEIKARMIIIPVPQGVVPAITLQSHSGIGQQTRVQYFEGNELIYVEDIYTPPNDFSLHPPLYLQRSLSNNNRIEIISWGVQKAFALDLGGPAPESLRAKVRESKTWGKQYVYAYETEDHWNNNTWDDTRIGYSQNFPVLAPLTNLSHSLVRAGTKAAFLTDKNKAQVSISVDDILERGAPNAKVRFEFATSTCDGRRAKGIYEYTAVTEDFKGRVSRKQWSRAFEGYAPVFTLFEYPSVAVGEELSEIVDARVVSSSCP